MDQLANSLIYNDCISADCSYFVKNGDRFCPNCGMDQLHMEIVKKEKNVNIAIFAIIAGYGVSALGLIMILTVSSNTAGILPLIVGIVLIIVGLFLYDKNKVSKIACPFLSLSDSEKLIAERLRQIEVPHSRIKDVLGQVRFKDEDKWQKFRENLEMARGVIEKQSARYNIKLHEIHFLRWQNLIASSFTNRSYSEFHKANASMKKLDKFILKGRRNYNKLEKELEKFGDVGEKLSLLERYRETLASCDKIKDALIEQQAMLAIRDISSLSEDASALALPPNVIREIEAFNASIDIDNFSNSIKELEAEFERIKIEDNLSGETRQLMEQTGNI